MTLIKYPSIRRGSVVEVLHGKKIADPYRWLEDSSSEETKQFVKDQNQLFNDYISKYQHKETLRSKITEMFNYERFGCPFKRGDSYYYFYNSGLQPQSVLMRQSTLSSDPVVFFDPNTLSTDGTISLSRYSFSKSGKYFGYGLSVSGSDWVTINVKDTESGAKLSDVIEWAKFTSIEWINDESGFFYTKYKPPAASEDAGTETESNKDPQVYFHKLGTSQEADKLVYQDSKNPEYTYGVEVSDDGKYFVLTINQGCDPFTKVYIASMENEVSELQFVKLIDEFKAEYHYITNEGSLFYFKTTHNAPKSKVVAIDLNSKSESVVVAETQDVLEDCSVVDQNKLVLVYMRDVKHVLLLHDLMGNLLEKQPLLPVGSVVQSMSARKEDNFLFYYYNSFTTPGIIQLYDFTTEKSCQFKSVSVKGHDPLEFDVQQKFYESKDGTRVPMFIIGLKDKPLSPETPTLLYGYGGFNVSLTPFFSVNWLAFIKSFNAQVVVANLRGGGEYGEEWNKNGKLDKKQNVFDDFIYAAKYLISNQYTSTPKLAISGGSNGGLLVSACVLQEPALFGCVVADVGVLDMLRFQLFTIGAAWSSDYGDTRGSQKDMEVALKYSPLHNVQTCQLPPILLTTSDHDDRVSPLHTYKFAAELQHKNPENSTILVRIETKAGHGAGKSTQQRIDEATEKFSFMALALGL